MLKKDETYSVPRTTVEMQADGSNIHVTVDLFFQVLRVEHGTHKPKLLKTFKDEADPKVYDGILIQYMEVHNRPRPGCVVAFFDSDPSTINIHDLSSFDQVEQSLMKWVVNPSATAGCVDLSGSSRAIPVAAILDIDCPVFTILRALRNRGWKPQALSVVHDSLAIGDFDYRQPHSKRFYFQCLLTLEDVVRNNPSFKSDQPNSYFLLLKKGIVVEAGLGDKAYKDKLRAQKDFSVADSVFALEDQAPALAIEDDDFEIGGRYAKHDFPPIGGGGRSGGSHGGAGSSGDRPAVPKALPAPPSIAPLAAKKSSSSDSSSESDSNLDSSSNNFELGGKRGDVSSWIVVDGSHKVKLDRYKPAGKTEYVRFIMPCPIEGHKGCERKRAAHMNKRLGRVEPIAYLCAWADLGKDVDKVVHCQRNFPVPSDLVAAWAKRIGKHVDAKLDVLKL